MVKLKDMPTLKKTLGEEQARTPKFYLLALLWKKISLTVSIMWREISTLTASLTVINDIEWLIMYAQSTKMTHNKSHLNDSTFSTGDFQHLK